MSEKFYVLDHIHDVTIVCTLADNLLQIQWGIGGVKMRGIVRSIMRSRAEKAEREGARSVTLYKMRSIVITGPALTFFAGLMLILNSTLSRDGICLLFIFVAVYYGINRVLYTRICRIASLQLMMAIGFAIVSLTSLLAVQWPLIAAGFDTHLGSLALLSISYIAVLGFGLHQAKKGLRKFNEGPLGARIIDFERGTYDLTSATKPARDFVVDRPIEHVSEPEPTSVWTWILGLGAFLASVFSALAIAFSGDLEQSKPALIIMLFGLLFALFFGFLGLRSWLNYWWYRTWERKNGKPILIKYLEDRHSVPSVDL